MGGVLLDWNPRHLYRKLIADPEEMERFLATVTTTQWHGLQDQGGNPAQATRRLTADHPGKEALIEAFYGRFDEMLDHPFPQMADLVERLHRAGTPLYLLSNAPGFLDAWLRGPAHQAKLAAAIHQGVRDYFYANPPSGTRVAQLATAAPPRPTLTAGGDSGE